jgi:hypothetical protein
MSHLHETCPSRIRFAYLIAAVATGGLLPIEAATAADVWKDRTEVVWSKETHTLIRKNFRVWDPHPELDLDFLWEPRGAVSSDNADSFANGAGTLSWHVKGAPDYDRQFAHSVFKGVLKDGRPEGEGALVVFRGGLSYTGQWVGGVMQGYGVLRFANGDKYDGDFVAGKMQGEGRYASTDGSVYIGEFRNGLRDGAAKSMLADGSYRTIWRAGKEIDRQPIPNSTPQPAMKVQLVAISTAVKLKLSLDEEKNADFYRRDSDTEAHNYDADYSPGLMTIHLGSKARLEAWKGNGKIISGDESGPQRIVEDSDIAQVSMKVEVENGGIGAAQITDASLVVAESVTDPEPYVELGTVGHVVCNQIGETYSPGLSFSNLGWGQVRDARVTYSLGIAEKRTDETTVPLGTFDGSKQISVVDRLRKLGVNTDRLQKATVEAQKNATADRPKLTRYAFQCGPKDDNESEDHYREKLAACVRNVKQTGVFGSLSDFVFASENVIYTTVAGRIEYKWADGDGKINIKASPFSVNIPLVTFHIEMGEGFCGESGDRAKKSPGRNILLLDSRNYQVHLPKTWNVRLAQSSTTEFQLDLSAAKSSRHQFHLVLQLADGSQAASAMVDLSYFRPRFSNRR